MVAKEEDRVGVLRGIHARAGVNTIKNRKSVPRVWHGGSRGADIGDRRTYLDSEKNY